MNDTETVYDELKTNTDLDDAAQELYEAIKNVIAYQEQRTYRKQSDKYYNWVIDRFEDIKTPHPLDFEDMAKAVRAVTIAMTGDSENNKAVNFGDPDFLKINTAHSDFQAWDGDFAKAVTDNFLTPMPGIMSNHGKVAYYLLDRIVTMAHIYARRRNDAHKIAKDGVTAIEAWRESKGASLGLFLAIVISVGTAITGLGGFATGAIAAAAVTAGSGAIIGGTIGSALEPDEEEIPMGSNIIYDVIDNIQKALDKNDEKMKEEEEKLLKNIDQEAEKLWRHYMKNPTPDHPLWPVTPMLFDTVDGRKTHSVKDGILVIN